MSSETALKREDRTVRVEQRPGEVSARTVEAVQRAIPRAPVRGLLADGNLSGVMDSSSNRGGQLISLTGGLANPAVISIDWQARTAWVSGGASIADISRELLAHGWTLTNLAGSSSSTLAGALALDLRAPHHSSTQPADTSPQQVVLVDGRSQVRQLSAADSGSAHIATVVGGLGLTGICTSAELPIRPVSSGWMIVDSQRHSNPDEVFDSLSSPAIDGYSFARIDPTAVRSGIGRGTVVTGRHAKVLELPENLQPDALRYVPSSATRKLPALPSRITNLVGSKALLNVTQRTAPALRRDELVPISTFFHSSAEARIASKRTDATITYAFSVPSAQADLIPRFLERLTHISGHGDHATVQRRTGPSFAPLGVVVTGWDFAIELACDTPGLGRMLDDWDERVAGVGGQVWLGTDTRMRPEAVAAMYPQLETWHGLRDEFDPGRHFCSDLSRRLAL